MGNRGNGASASIPRSLPLLPLLPPEPPPSPPPHRLSPAGIGAQMREARLDYDAALDSRFRRRRTRLYGGAGAHLTPYHANKIREYARDMSRNDAIVSAIAWRAVDNVVRTGLSLVPQTGDAGLDRELKARQDDWAEDPLRCDVRGLLTFHQMERMAAYAEIVDGDIFGVFDPDGALQLVEGEWCMSGSNAGGRIYHGVEIDDAGRPVAYHFSEPPRATRFSHVVPLSGYDSRPIERFDAHGYANVVHVYAPDRVTQYRGVTAFHAVFDRLGMVEDIEFARLVQQQLVSCMAVFLESDPTPKIGKQTSQTAASGDTEVVENISAGTITRLRAGERPYAFAPKVPNPEYFDHIRQQVRTIAAALGLPLEIVLFDTTQTTFHGYRGAMQQARIGFECRQRAFPTRLHRPTYARNVARWLPDLGRAAAVRFRRGTLFQHDWHGAGFPYVDPFKDAQADDLRMRTLQVSPRRLAQERGYRREDIVAETIDDRADAIEAAAQRAERLNEILDRRGARPVTWRELLGESYTEMPDAAPAPAEGDAAPPEPPPEIDAESLLTSLLDELRGDTPARPSGDDPRLTSLLDRVDRIERATTSLGARLAARDQSRGQPGNAGQFGPGGGGGAKPASPPTGAPAAAPTGAAPTGAPAAAPTGAAPSGAPPATTPPGAKVKTAPPGSQLPAATVAALRALGGPGMKLPAAKIAAHMVRIADLTAANVHEVALLRWRDSANVGQSEYSAEYHRRSAERRWARVQAILPAFDGIRDGLDARMRGTGAGAEGALVAAMIAETALRPGGGRSKVFGATTLQGRHVFVREDGGIDIAFRGKENVINRASIDPGPIADRVAAAARDKGPREALFSPNTKTNAMKELRAAATDAGMTPAVLREAVAVRQIPGKAKPEHGVLLKDLRTVVGTRTAAEAAAALSPPPPPLSGDAKADARLIAARLKTISEAVATKLNNSANVAAKSYIHPNVFAAWRQKVGA